MYFVDFIFLEYRPPHSHPSGTAADGIQPPVRIQQNVRRIIGHDLLDNLPHLAGLGKIVASIVEAAIIDVYVVLADGGAGRLVVDDFRAAGPLGIPSGGGRQRVH